MHENSELFNSKLLYSFNKLIWRNFRLFENTMQCPDCDFAMQRHNATNISLWHRLFHHNMASTLPRLNETKPFQCADDFPPRYMWQIRHELLRQRLSITGERLLARGTLQDTVLLLLLD